MAKALFLSLPLPGHTNPSLPLVRELVARGDEIIYYSAAAFAAIPPRAVIWPSRPVGELSWKWM